jgi:hypothetical protein
MITTEHTKVKMTGGELRNYISYFQSVTTIGIINRARNSDEAESKARRKLDNSDFMCGVVGQTPFELHATDEWKPKLPSNHDVTMDDTIDVDEPVKIEAEPLILNLDDQTKKCICDKIGKTVEQITHQDYLDFVKWCVNQGLA